MPRVWVRHLVLKIAGGDHQGRDGRGTLPGAVTDGHFIFARQNPHRGRPGMRMKQRLTRCARIDAMEADAIITPRQPQSLDDRRVIVDENALPGGLVPQESVGNVLDSTL